MQSIKRWGLAACLLLPPALHWAAPFQEGAADSTATHTPASISTLAEAVSQASPLQRHDFTWIALSEVIGAYEAALGKSNSEAPVEAKARNKLIRWRAGTRRFLEELHAVLDRLQHAREIQITAMASGPPVLFIDGDPVVISGPEIGKARLMEGRIIDAYCALHDCTGLQPEEAQPEIRIEPIGAGRWTLQGRGQASYTTPDGLVFLFSDVTDRRRKQSVCELIAGELRTLVSELQQAERSGQRIDWNLLSVESLTSSDAQHVRLSAEGDYLSLKLPRLAASRLLQGEARKWTRANVAGSPTEEIEIHADRLLD